MAARFFTTSFQNVAVSAVQDLVSLKNPSSKLVEITRVWLMMTDVTIQTAQGWNVNCKFSTATFTAGSLGSAGTVVLVDKGDGAASATTRTNDTTQGTTSGAFTNVYPLGGHNYAGIDYKFSIPIPVILNEGFVFELDSAPTGTCHFSGGIEWTEKGG